MVADVVILCGGRGIRMLEETEIRPKPMVEIGGKPILWHIMKYYASYGFKRFILALGYKGEVIKHYFHDGRASDSDVSITANPHAAPSAESNARELEWEIACVDTGIANLKGSRLKQLEPHVTGDRFHLTYGDGLSTIDLRALDAFHHHHGAIGTVTAVHPPSRFGELSLEGDQVTRFEEKSQLATGFINGGFFVFNRRIFEYLTRDPGCDFEFGALQRLAADGQLRAFRHEGFWQCMDTVRERDYLNELAASQKAEWKLWEKACHA